MTELNNQDTNNNHNEDCVFCKIIEGTIPAYKVYEDEETLAFLDIKPNNFGQTLVIPKDHTENIYTVPAEQLCRTMLTAQKIAIAIRNTEHVDGINIVINNEPAAGQVINHVHIHIIPRLNDDGFRHWETKPYKEGEMALYQEKIKAEIN